MLLQRCLVPRAGSLFGEAIEPPVAHSFVSSPAMLCAAAHSTLVDTEQAVAAVVEALKPSFEGTTIDLVCLFATRGHTRAFPQLGATLAGALAARHLIGCTGESIACNDVEIEQSPCLAVWGASLPGARIDSFEVDFQQTPDGWMCAGLPEADESTEPATIFVLGDPYSCAVDTLLERLSEEYPTSPVIGGMASGGRQAGDSRLFRDSERVLRGAVGVIVRGGPPIRAVVSQGCRPVGSPLIVTKANRNLILELGGRPPLVRFQEIYGVMPERDRELVHKGLHVGIAMSEYRERFLPGDFLISNVLGADQESGAIAIGNPIRVGQTIQFHVRDHETADEDLRQLLQQADNPAARGALMFTCNGRGTRLFPAPHHDATTVQEICGPLPLAGFFAQGELGPVGGRNYIHGFTASIALFGGPPEPPA
jgi:small ligand-binding sensory domain FIST